MPLRPVKRGDVYYAFGTVARQRVRQSLGTGDRTRAEELAAQLEARLWKRHSYGEEAVRSFDEAALSYQLAGGERRFLPADHPSFSWPRARLHKAGRNPRSRPINLSGRIPSYME